MQGEGVNRSCENRASQDLSDRGKLPRPERQLESGEPRGFVSGLSQRGTLRREEAEALEI